MEQLSPLELQQWLADSSRAAPLLLDVREPHEYALCHIAGSLPLPLGELPARVGELDQNAEIVAICHHGMRSFRAGSFLEQAGFAHVYNLQGGVDAWAHDVDPAMARY